MVKCISVLGLIVVVAGSAAQNPSAGKKVTVTMVVILASEEGSFVDKKLKAIAEEVRLKRPHLKSFRIKNMEDRSLAPDEKSSFGLVDKKNALVVVKHGADKDNRVGLIVTPPDQNEIVYTSVCGKFLPIVTGYRTKNKELLILAIRVQPCKGE